MQRYTPALITVVCAIGLLGVLLNRSVSPDSAIAVFALEALAVTLPAIVLIVARIRSAGRGPFLSDTYVLWAVADIVWVVVGYAIGALSAIAPQTEAVVDPSYSIAHYQFVTRVAAAFALFAGVYYWLPQLSGFRTSPVLGKTHFWLVIAGVAAAFLPIALMGSPTGLSRYTDTGNYFALLVIASTGGAALIGLGMIVFVAMLIETFVRRRPTAAG